MRQKNTLRREGDEDGGPADEAHDDGVEISPMDGFVAGYPNRVVLGEDEERLVLRLVGLCEFEVNCVAEGFR